MSILFTREENGQNLVLHMEGAMTIYEGVTIRDELRNCFKQSDRLILDLAAVHDCDTAGVQLLCSAYKTARSRNGMCSLNNVSDAVLEAMQRTGLNLEEFWAAGEE